MHLTIRNEEIQDLNDCEQTEFPKYTSQLINWANQNAQGTRPKVVGQLSELFPEFLSETEQVSVEKWASWYSDRYPNAIEKATERVQIWVKDFVITKTYNGMYLQKAILAKIAKIKNLPYRLSCSEEESIGIDGYVGEVAYSIKSDTYKTMNRLSEEISVKMIYYKKTKTGLTLEIDD